MSTQRKLLAVLLAVAAALAILLAISLRRPSAPEEADLVREKDPPAPAPRPAEPTEDSEGGRNALATVALPAPAHKAEPARELGPPVKIVGKIGDEKGNGLEAVNVLVYDSRAEAHKPELLRPDWYECTIHERGRALVVAQRDGNCTAEVPFEVLPPDEERHVDLVLPSRPQLRVHVRDLSGKPLPRFASGQPLRARLRAVASYEELPGELTAPMVMQCASTETDVHLGWADFEPESLMSQLLAGIQIPRGARGKSQKGSKRNDRPWSMLSDLDEKQFGDSIALARSAYTRRLEADGHVEEGDSMRRFLSALGYVGEDGTPIEGESPKRDVIGTLTLDRPLPLRISLLAGQRLLESRDPVPWTEDILYKIDLERLAEQYVHAWLFASDSITGARLPGVRANLHVEPLPGLEDPPDVGRSIPSAYAGHEAPPQMGAPKGWRFPEGDVTTDLDGRADFRCALAGWCKLTLAADGHVPVTKWIDVERADECYLGNFELAPLATSRLTVVDPGGNPVRAHFDLWPQLHAKGSEGTLECWGFDSEDSGALLLKNIGRQQLLLRSSDTRWALEPLVLDNVAGLVDRSELKVAPAQHVLLHLPARLPLDSLVNVAQGLTRALYEEAFGGKTLIELWVADGTYTLRVSEGVTALLTLKFTVAGEPQLVEVDR